MDNKRIDIDGEEKESPHGVSSSLDEFREKIVRG
jgi:hypothetical protein